MISIKKIEIGSNLTNQEFNHRNYSLAIGIQDNGRSMGGCLLGSARLSKDLGRLGEFHLCCDGITNLRDTPVEFGSMITAPVRITAVLTAKIWRWAIARDNLYFHKNALVYI